MSTDTTDIDPLASNPLDGLSGQPPAKVTEQAAPKAGKSAKTTKVAAEKDAKYWDEKVWVQFNESEDMPPHGIPVGVNGTAYLIRPGVPIKVPRKVLHAVDNAVADRPIIDNGKVRDYRKVSRFTYSRIDAPNE